MIHALQSVPHMSSKSCEYYKMAGLAPGTSYNETFKIEVRARRAGLSVAGGGGGGGRRVAAG